MQVVNQGAASQQEAGKVVSQVAPKQEAVNLHRPLVYITSAVKASQIVPAPIHTRMSVGNVTPSAFPRIMFVRITTVTMLQ